MSKFTIFTIILAVCVITVTVDLSVREYAAKYSQASVISDPADSPLNTDSPPAAVAPSSTSDTVIENPPAATPEQSAPQFSSPVASSKITEAIIKQAGFTGTLKEDQFNGKVFQLLDITKIPVQGIGFHQVLQENIPVATLTEISLPDEIRALQMYVLLQNKTKTYIDLTLNETNAYGDRSFYINHAKKPDEAFLTVKIGKTIYAFAYVKPFHAQVKKLIALLT